MPELSRFFGIVVTMHYDDHAPPHFHVRYAGQKAVVSIDPPEVLHGKLQPRALGLVIEWASNAPCRIEENWLRAMLKDIVEVRALGEYRVHLRFEDGVQGELDLGRMLRFRGVFAPLADEHEFAKVRVDPELGTIVWPNGADLDPDVLYAEVTGKPIRIPDAG